MARKKEIFTNIMLICISCIIAVGIGEFFTRTFFPHVTMFPRYLDTKEYPILLPGNARIVNKRGDLWEFVYETNELGHRGQHIPISQGQSKKKVIALGDSFTFGMGVQDDEVYTEILIRELGKDFLVINAGMGGWGIDSEIKRYYEKFKAHNPDYVILQFTRNDLSDSTSGVTKISGGQFVFSNLPHSKPWWQNILSNSSIVQNSNIYAAIRNAYDFRRAKATLEAAEGGGTAEVGKIDAQQENAAQTSIDNQSSPLEKNYVSMLNLFAEELSAQDVSLLFVSVTHNLEAGIDHYDLDHFPEIKAAVEKLATAGLLHFVDLPLEKMEPLDGSPEGHQWGAGHHQLVGEAIANEIAELESDEEGSANLRAASEILDQR